MVSKRADADERSKRENFPTVEMVEKAQAGDQTAFHRLVDHFQPEIYRMIFYRTRSQMDAEDLTQDVMLKTYKHIGRLKSPEVFRSWLYRIAVNRVRDYYRKKQIKSMFGMVSMDEENFHESEEMAVAPEAVNGISRKDFWRQIEQMLTALSRMEKEVFLLRFFDQLTITEMSAALKKNESTIKTHLYRALRKVKSLAGDLDGLMEGV
jgi:RNA polymerase sigma-70 factor (ECF subfamily)